MRSFVKAPWLNWYPAELSRCRCSGSTPACKCLCWRACPARSWPRRGAPLGYEGAAEQRAGGQRHYLGGVDHVLDHHIFIRLMRQIENSRSVGDAIAQLADAIDVLLIVSAGRTNELGLAAEHTADGRRGAAGHGAIAVGQGGTHFENVANTVAKPRALFGQHIQQVAYLALDAIEAFLDQQSAVDDHAAGIRHQRGGISRRFLLATVNRIDIQRRMTRA